MSSTTFRTILPLFAAVLVLCACGASADDDPAQPAITVPVEQATRAPTPGPQSSGTVDACALITADEAAATLGGAVDPPIASQIGEGFAQCLFRIAGGTDVDPAVVIQARDDTSPDDFKRLVEENAPEELGEVTSISGLGDVAYEQMATFVLSGDRMVVVTVISESGDDSASQQMLANKAIDRLD